MQPTLFGTEEKTEGITEMVLYALGDFQSRGHQLAGRELALDRLYGAFVRACEKYNIAMPSDDELVAELSSVGAKVIKLPNFMAKRPFRVTVSKEIADKAETFFTEAASKG